MHNEFDLMREYDEFINDQHDTVEINGVEFLGTEILKRDQIAYREGFLDWCNSNNYEF